MVVRLVILSLMGRIHWLGEGIAQKFLKAAGKTTIIMLYLLFLSSAPA